MTSPRTLTSLLLATLLSAGCTKGGSGYRVLHGNINSIALSSDTIRYGERIEVVVLFGGGNDGCAKAGRLETWHEPGRVTVEAFYEYPRSPGACTQHVPVHSLSFTYKPLSRGIHIIRAANDLSVADTLSVQ